MACARDGHGTTASQPCIPSAARWHMPTCSAVSSTASTSWSAVDVERALILELVLQIRDLRACVRHLRVALRLVSLRRPQDGRLLGSE